LGVWGIMVWLVGGDGVGAGGARSGTTCYSLWVAEWWVVRGVSSLTWATGLVT
jgi:hypothetical protein